MSRSVTLGALRGTRLGAGHLFVMPWIVAALVGTAQGQVSQNPAAASDQAVRQAESVRAQQELQKQAKDQQSKSAPAEDEPPETYPGENADLGPQKLLKQKKKKPLFDFSSDTMLTWTSNAMSQATGPSEARVLAETMSLAFAPEPLDIGIGKLGVRGGYRHLFYIYDAFGGCSLNASNFEMSTLFLGGNLSFLEKWNASLGMDYGRVMMLPGPAPKKWSYEYVFDPSKWQEGFVDWSPNWALMRSVSFNDKLNLILSYSGAYHFTEASQIPELQNRTNSNDKLDSTLMASLMWSLTSKWMLQPSMRLTHSLYTQPTNAVGDLPKVHRRDRTLGPSLSVMWSPTPRVSCRASVGGEFRNSNDPLTQNYSKFEASIGLSAALKF